MEKQTFEEKMEELNQIAQKLENENLNLEEMVTLVNRSNFLLKDLESELKEAKKKIEENQ